jgi:hypothetical protein
MTAPKTTAEEASVRVHARGHYGKQRLVRHDDARRGQTRPGAGRLSSQKWQRDLNRVSTTQIKNCGNRSLDRRKTTNSFEPEND